MLTSERKLTKGVTRKSVVVTSTTEEKEMSRVLAVPVYFCCPTSFIWVAGHTVLKVEDENDHNAHCGT